MARLAGSRHHVPDQSRPFAPEHVLTYALVHLPQVPAQVNGSTSPDVEKIQRRAQRRAPRRHREAVMNLRKGRDGKHRTHFHQPH